MSSAPTPRPPAVLHAPSAVLRPAAPSIIVPACNESGNIAELVRRVAAALPGVAREIIFVDDSSPDGTIDTVRRVAAGSPRMRIPAGLASFIGAVVAALWNYVASSNVTWRAQ